MDNIKHTLLSMAEPSYRDFSASLMPTVDKNRVLGVRIPLLRKYAKSLEDYGGFLRELPHEYFEEDNLHAFLIEREKDFDTCIALLDAFLPYIDNWATCDSLKPKALAKEPEKLLIHIKRWLRSDKTYTVRFAVNLLMSFYLGDDFCDEYARLVADIRSDEYYVNMVCAWYFATALAKQYESIVPYLERCELDEWTHRKTIQKAVESYRITKEQKTYLRSLR